MAGGGPCRNTGTESSYNRRVGRPFRAQEKSGALDGWAPTGLGSECREPGEVQVRPAGAGDAVGRVAVVRVAVVADEAKRRPGALGVTIDGRPVEARIVVVANNHYKLELFSLGARERLDEACSTSTSLPAGCPRPGTSEPAGTSSSTQAGAGCGRQSTASPRSSRRRCGSRSSAPRYACFCRQVSRTSAMWNANSSVGGSSSGANQPTSLTSSAASGSPETTRAVQ